MYEPIGGFGDLPHAADWDIWIRLAAAGADRVRR
jgi:hypothetical protein